ncbi:MAG: selenoneine biosynthesis selenosugar synthase SenB [Burkholderiaceae bacterium]
MTSNRPIPKPQPARVVIVTPARPQANNGNWQTTARWAQFLSGNYDVSVQSEWDGSAADLLIGLHARRSSASIADFANTGKPLVVVLTGTDLYRDIRTDDSARASLARATKLVVLQTEGLKELTDEQQLKAVVIEQSAPRLAPRKPRQRSFDLVMVGHMRTEKDPLTALRAIEMCPNPTLRLRHIGRTDDPQVGPAALDLARDDARIELLGPMSHDQTREIIRQGRILLLPSLMEGGANVLIEAVTSSIPVLATRIPGSIGMLGTDYVGYFAPGDFAALARLIGRCQSDSSFIEHLKAQCEARAHLFDPQRESDRVNALVKELLTNRPQPA